MNIVYHIKLKKKSHMIISVNATKAFDKIQHPFMIKTPGKLEIKGNFLKLVKPVYKNL